MGADKALLPWGSGQLIDHVIGIVAAVVGMNRTIIVGDREPYRGRGPAVVADLYPGVGPLGGIATALRSWEGGSLLVVAVDMPFLSTDLLRAMTDEPFSGDALVPLTPSGRTGLRPQALHAIYRRGALRVLQRNIEQGRLKVSNAFDSLDVRFLEPAWLQQYDPELRSFENANTPEAYRRLREEAADGS